METLSRSLAAVWFADIVGYTSLASRDETTAVEVVRVFQQLARREVESHDGTVVKFFGDGVLAYSTSTSAALQAALSLRAEFRSESAARAWNTQLRIGLHVGDIVIAPDRDVYGDGVNVAARLQDAAEPGRVVVSEDVWRQVRQRSEFLFSPLGPRRLKGLPQPIWAYEAAPAGEDTPVSEAGEQAAETRSVAVLPFTSLSPTGDAGVLADGLHNDLITALSKVAGLTVISRTSVMGYRGSDKPAPLIGRELNAPVLVEGAVQSSGNRLRLTVQLVDSQRDIHIWAESYDRELTAENLFGIQTELAGRVVDSLSAELIPEQAETQPRPPTRDLDAYRLAAEARMQLDLRTEPGFARAAELFERAVDLDPAYVAARVGLADALILTQDYGFGRAEELLPRAENALHTALELDPESAEAHASLGLLHTTRQDAPAAVREFEKAGGLKASYAEAWNWISWVGLLSGWKERALYAAERAVELNPLSAEAVSHLGLSLLAVGRFSEAVVETRRAVELSSSFTTGSFYLGVALYESGRYNDADRVLEPLSLATAGELTVPWAGMGPDATLALCDIARGESDRAEAVLGEAKSNGYGFAAGLIHGALGNLDGAFTAFGEAGERGAWQALAVHHFYGTVWARLRSDERHRDVARAVYRSWNLDPPS